MADQWSKLLLDLTSATLKGVAMPDATYHWSSTLLDPEQLKKYSDALAALNEQATKFGPEGFKMLMELEKQRITLEGQNKLAEIRATTAARVVEMKKQDELRQKKFDARKWWQRVDPFFVFSVMCVLLAVVLAIVKG